MIRLTKLDEPDVLAQNGSAWLVEFTKVVADGGEPTESQKNRYRHPKVKEKLIEETSGKCAYCEWKLLVGAFGDIEHIVPKSLKPELRFAWSNLTLACDVCNGSKGAHSDLIDPYVDDPDLHFRFLGPMIMVRPDSDIGKRTHAVLKLNRTALLEHRREKLDDFVRRVHEISATSNQLTRAILLNALIEDAESAKNEFAGCTRSFVRDMRADGSLP